MVRLARSNDFSIPGFEPPAPLASLLIHFEFHMSSVGAKNVLFRYQHNGVTWGFEIKASIPKDANARYNSVLVASVPVPDLRGQDFWLAILFLK